MKSLVVDETPSSHSSLHFIRKHSCSWRSGCGCSPWSRTQDVTSVSARPFPQKKIFLIFYLCIPTACSSAWLIVYSGIFVEYVNSDMWQRKAPTDIQDRDVITAKYFAVLLPSHKMLTAVLIGVRFHSPLPPGYGTVPVLLNSLPFTNLSNGQIYRVGVNRVSSDGVGRDLIRCGSCPQGMCAVHTWGNHMAS